MYNIIHLSKLSLFHYFIVFMLFFLMIGCAGIGAGRIVLMDNRILLSDEQAKEGTFIDHTNSLNYSYSLESDVMKVEGEVFARDSISSLRVRMLLLDVKGAILESKNIYNSGYRNFYHGKISKAFSQTILLSNEVKGFTFDFFVEYRTRR